MRTCDACGKPEISSSIGGAFLCRTCAVDVKAEIDTVRSQGKQINALGIARKIYRETFSTGNYMLRDIPADLMNAAKQKALDESSSVRDIILKSLRLYLT